MPASHSANQPPDQPSIPATVAEAMLRISGSVNLDDIVDGLLGGGMELPGVTGASVWWTDTGGKQLRLIRSKGPRTSRTITIGSAREIKRALDSGEFRLIEPKAGRLPGGYRGGAVLACPIVDDYQQFGILLLAGPSADALAGNQSAAGLLTHQASTAIVGAARLRQLLDSSAASEQQVQKLQKLYQVLEQFAGIRSEEVLLRLIPKVACSVFGYSYAIIAGVQGTKLSFIRAVVRPPGNPEFTKAAEHAFTEDIANRPMVATAIRERQPIAVDNPRTDPRIRHAFFKRHCADLIAVPLVEDDQVVAVFYVAHHRSRDRQAATTPDVDLELLNVFSRLCGYALSTIRYSAYRRRGIDIARIPARTVEEFTAEVVRKLPGLASARDAVIALPNESGKLVPVASTDPTLITKRYRSWLARLPFKRYGFALPGFPESRAAGLVKGTSLASPILYENENLGLVHVLGRASGNFTVKDLALMQLMTTRIGYVLKNLEFVHRISQEKQQFASIVHNTADGIVSIDADGRIRFFNQAMETITGYRGAEVLGGNFSDICDPRTEDGTVFEFGTLDRPIKQGTALAVTASIRTQSGDRRWVGITATPQGSGDERRQTILVVRDITEAHQLIERQREFVSIASHEMRTPLTALVGYLSLVQSNNGNIDQTQQERFTERAYAAATRLSELVEDLLSVTRIEEGRVALNLKPINPGTVTADVVANLQPAAAGKRQRIEFKNMLAKTDRIIADRSKLHQVLANLVDNAIKYTPEDGSVTVTATSSERYVTIRVADSGIGIHPDNLERVFEKFFREYTELSVGAGGTGLGLFITKGLVEQQGGTLTITSRQGKGTTARIRFPRAPKNAVSKERH